MTVLRFAIEQSFAVTVDVDVDKYVSAYQRERAAFDGTDEDFVKEGVGIEAADILSNPLSDSYSGMTVRETEFGHDIDVSFLGVVAS